MMKTEDKKVTAFWTNVAIKQLLGRKIKEVRYMTTEEAEDLDWSERPVVIVLDDGNMIYPSQDDEGNGAGALFTCDPDHPTLPVLR
jgi:hypothetical protein